MIILFAVGEWWGWGVGGGLLGGGGEGRGGLLEGGERRG